MKLITRDTDYAVRALCYIAKKKAETVSVSDLVKKLHIPRPFLRKILQILNTEGLLHSYKGQGGGFELVRQPGKIFLTDLIEIFQGKFRLNECFFKKKPCRNRDVCPLKKKLDFMERSILSELKSVTIKSLVEEEKR